ncbi:carboxypeptidase-like regulatory domain-containing protein [Terracidiphilus sp.]|jgi:Carboxypeptidase regulatory-like domain|uniref:carboxypeptidase-like regulatory domain-containing protein n=1 Tax=Terracidiphilus sp. TaxID=1964191 RepID=UPI003C202509
MARKAGTPFRWLLLFLLAGTAAANLTAQISSGSLAGNIQDANGAVVPNATVTATNDATHIVAVVKSTSAGAYRFPTLTLGAYTVTAVAPGFSTATETGVVVQISSTTALDIKLAVGEVSQTVTVDASGLRIETESSDISGTVSNKQIEDLPLSLATGVGGLR